MGIITFDWKAYLSCHSKLCLYCVFNWMLLGLKYHQYRMQTNSSCSGAVQTNSSSIGATKSLTDVDLKKLFGDFGLEHVDSMDSRLEAKGEIGVFILHLQRLYV